MRELDRREFLGHTVALGTVATAGSAVLIAPAHANTPTEVRKMNAAHRQDRFTIANSIVMLVDHQTGTVGWVKSQPQKVTIASSRAMARMALEYNMPLVMTTTMEENVGPTIPDLAQLAPDQYAKRYKRGGQLSCWDDTKLAADVRSLNRKRIILAGLTTDICLFWAAADAVGLGYDVMVVADACGSMSALSDQLTYDRLRDMGVTVTGVNQMMTELVNNFGTPEGQKAMKINLEEVINKLLS
jgi:isochorismate hydrolase